MSENRAKSNRTQFKCSSAAIYGTLQKNNTSTTSFLSKPDYIFIFFFYLH